MENYLPFTPVYNEAFLALLHELTEIVNSGFNHFSTTNNPDIYLSITGLYKSVFEDGNLVSKTNRDFVDTYDEKMKKLRELVKKM